MPIEFRCTQCNQLLRVPDTSGGKNARCPKCQALMQVPLQESGMPPAPLPAPPAVSTDFRLGSPAGNSPFSDAIGRGPEGPVASPPPPSQNPFGDGRDAMAGFSPAKPTLENANPYATPTLAAAGYAGADQQFAPRSGLPWETRPRSFSSWWDTMALIIGSPTRAFTQMRQYGGLGSPIMFSIWSMGLPMAVLMLLVMPIVVLVAIGVGADEGPGAGVATGVIGTVLVFAFAILNVLLGATITAMIAAALYHVCLILVGGARQGYETTFRAFSFVQGALFPVALLLVIVPFGGFIHLIWMIVLLVIAISRAHEIPGEKATFAVLLPFGVCCVLWVGLFVLAMVAGSLQ